MNSIILKIKYETYLQWQFRSAETRPVTGIFIMQSAARSFPQWPLGGFWTRPNVTQFHNILLTIMAIFLKPCCPSTPTNHVVHSPYYKCIIWSSFTSTIIAMLRDLFQKMHFITLIPIIQIIFPQHLPLEGELFLCNFIVWIHIFCLNM